MVFVSVENKGAYRCLTAWRAGHSKIMCNSSATATLQPVTTLTPPGGVRMMCNVLINRRRIVRTQVPQQLRNQQPIQGNHSQSVAVLVLPSSPHHISAINLSSHDFGLFLCICTGVGTPICELRNTNPS